MKTAPIAAKSDVFLNAIRQSGRRVTQQRRIICSYLAANHSHPTPSRVFADLSREHPELSRATVYNTLKMLQELGAIVEISFGDGHTHYETNTAPHINLVCLRCHSIIDLPVAPAIDGEDRALWRDTGFQPVAVKMDIFGFCESCRQRKKAEIRDQLLNRHDPANNPYTTKSEGIS
jgi:Fur family transcriptional regulator, peroxide stress response regulator